MIHSNMSPRQVAAYARREVGQVLRHAVLEHQGFAERCPPKCDKRIISLSDRATSARGLEWIYVLTATQGRITCYPLLWWSTTKGIHAMQVDAKGPASYFQEHVMARYLEYYKKDGDLFHSLRRFHSFNYAKACQPSIYKGDTNCYAAVIDDGYVAGEWCREEGYVHFRTFYDKKRGRRRFGHMEPAGEWQHLLLTVDFEHTSRRDTPHHAWGRGYRVTPELWKMAA